MKRLLLMLVMVLGTMAFAMSQDEDENKDGGRLYAIKVAFLTKKLNLSPEEAQKFWPIYNQYVKEVRTTRQDARKNKEKEIDTDEKLLKIRKKYDGEFAKALSQEKVNTFFRAEKEFGVILQKELMERRQRQLQRRRLKQ